MHACVLTEDLLAAAGDDLADEADFLGLGSVELTAGEGELTSLGTTANNLGEALEGTNVGSQAHLDLLDVGQHDNKGWYGVAAGATAEPRGRPLGSAIAVDSP